MFDRLWYNRLARRSQRGGVGRRNTLNKVLCDRRPARTERVRSGGLRQTEVRGVPLAVRCAFFDWLPPAMVMLVPADHLVQAGFEGMLRRPAELPLDFTKVDGITTVLTRPIRDELQTVLAQTHQTEEQTRSLTNRKLRVAAHNIGFASGAFLQDQKDAARVVFDLDPVTNLPAITMDW